MSQEPSPKRPRRQSIDSDDNYFDDVIQAINRIQVKPSAEVVSAQEKIADIVANIVKPGLYVGDRATTDDYVGVSDDKETEEYLHPGTFLDDMEGYNDALGVWGDNITEDDVDDEVENDTYDVKALLGQRLTAHIEALAKVKPVPVPASLATTPRLDQRYTAARLLFLTASTFKGGILGDPMGLGKTLSTLTAILAKPRQSSEGPPVIITKKAIVSHWITEIQKHTRPEHQPKVLVLDRPMSAFVLEGYDIVLTHYEHVQRQYSAKINFEQSHIGGAQKALPPRPYLSLFSDIHKDYGKPFQYVVLDEGQFAKKPGGATHQAISRLYRNATIILSGTFLDNKWGDCIGPLSLLKSHPFGDSTVFNATFASRTSSGKLRDPHAGRIKRIQKFLMAVTIVHPKTLLGLDPVDYEDVGFDLSEHEEKVSNDYFDQYRQALALSAKSPSKKDKIECLKKFNRAQQYSTHPNLHEAREDNIDESWLGRMKHPGVAIGSARMQAFDKLYDDLTREYPGEKVVIFSMSTAVLDLVEIVLEQRGVSVFRFDGRFSSKTRKANLDAFKASSRQPPNPLLTTALSGGVGLDIYEASIMIQMEAWWNVNWEHHTIGRLHRHGQTKQVKCRKLMANNALADGNLRDTQNKKDKVNQRILEVLVREDHKAPEIPVVFPGY